MKTITRRHKPIAFQQFELTMSIETQEQFYDMMSLFSFYTNIADVTNTNNPVVHKRMTDICMSIYDALEAEDQY
jgi:hypothetical protein